ncbi:B-cell receptor CD22-like isoform X2 [Sardina pilchardus]
MCFKGICILVVLFYLQLPAVQCGPIVTYSTTTVCGLKGASVVLPCKCHPLFCGGVWHKNRRQRVREHSRSHDCSLHIDKLTDEHTGVYHFEMHYDRSTSGITVTVTDVEMKEVDAGDENQTNVTCSTSCSLGSHIKYVWYKNGQTLQDKSTASILVPGYTQASYSCAVKGYERLRPPAKCVPHKKCWGVTYSFESICVLLGSSVDIPCTYVHPNYDTINTTFWFNTQKNNNHPEYLNLADEYKNHVEYHGNKKSSCTLRLKDIRAGHSGEYALRLTTKEGETYSGLPGVNISVTAVQVLTPPEAVTEGERVTLICNTTCTLSNDPTFIWYKNGQPVTNKHTTRDNKLHLNPVSSEDAGSYSCAVRGHETLSSNIASLNVRHKPTHVSVSISPSDGIEEGTSVTLTCSSDANPPVHTYTWYMKSGAESLVRGTGESISFNVTSDTSGLYYCEAHNELGSQNSGDAAVPPKEGLVISIAVTSGIIIAVMLALMLVFVRRYTMAREGTSTTQEVHSDIHDNTYTALNPRTISSEYDTLQNVRGVSDTYMPLQGTAQDSVYENLQRRETQSTEMELNDLSKK